MRPFTPAVYQQVRPWSPRSQGFPRADHVIPPAPVRQRVISMPKRLRDMLADRPRAVAALTKIFLTEIEQHLLAASGGAPDAETPRASRPRLGGISFLRRFGSALNHHVQLRACVTACVFVPPADHAGCDAPPVFLPARPVTQADLAALTERVRRRLIRWFRLSCLLDAAGPGKAREAEARGPRTARETARQLGNRCGGAVGRAIPRVLRVLATALACLAMALWWALMPR